ncbi:hydroxymethylglutaryl-CoA synthase [Candidatus Borreliella tachyglossi]|uniref:Hydroxymethylglutaryl-CoA synthase n=1 Tax=Candidatus Borreliella tachyglossi TaxID=1964448 RepID=A0A2S1LXK9_9SPIR|nr:hydroxymethylglutaryl-CoA synthase [Candidatus Borreliella tachyglossi]AWG43034.1 hydroxymethylglutaryl-CoA synthase [Candidatus Borreliella tachyglossi]
MKVGISDIRVFLPLNCLDFSVLLESPVYQSDENFFRKFNRAIDSTLQKAFRFTSPNEDSVTMASSAVKLIFDNNNLRLDKMRLFLGGTETGVDHSKSISSYVYGALKLAGICLQNNFLTFQIQHACAGAALALHSTASILSQLGASEYGIVFSSDIAHYSNLTTAEITQGAGATAVLIEQNPKLLSLNLSEFGTYTDDVDDFFRPFGSLEAKVRGRYSMECYNKANEKALADFAHKKNMNIKDLFSKYRFILHVPFAKMPIDSMYYVLKKYYSEDESECRAYLESIDFYDSIEASKEVGNLYTGSIFLSLMSYLKRVFAKKDIRGEGILLCSYGSGNIMVIYEAIIENNALSVVKTWDIDEILSVRHNASFDEYRDFFENKVVPGESSGFYLKEIREDGYRVYGYRA